MCRRTLLLNKRVFLSLKQFEQMLYVFSSEPTELGLQCMEKFSTLQAHANWCVELQYSST